MRMEFTTRKDGPERLVAEGRLVFGEGHDAGPLRGMAIHGFALWRSAEGDVFVTVPARAYGDGGGHRYFDMVRANNAGAMREFKQWVLDSYNGAIADGAEEVG